MGTSYTLPITVTAILPFMRAELRIEVDAGVIIVEPASACCASLAVLRNTIIRLMSVENAEAGKAVKLGRRSWKGRSS